MIGAGGDLPAAPIFRDRSHYFLFEVTDAPVSCRLNAIRPIQTPAITSVADDARQGQGFRSAALINQESPADAIFACCNEQGDRGASSIRIRVVRFCCAMRLYRGAALRASAVAKPSTHSSQKSSPQKETRYVGIAT